MNLTKIAAFVLLAAAVLGFTACNDNNDDELVTVCSVTSCYTMMTDKTAGGAPVASSEVSFSIEQDWNTAKADIKISGLRLPDGSSYTSFTLVDCPWSVDNDGWMVFSATNPLISSETAAAPSLDNFELKLLNRSVGQAYAPGVSFSFTVNSTYFVQGSRKPFFLIGETVSTPEGGMPFTSYSPTYSVDVDNAKSEATINIMGAQFANGMPALNISFAGIKSSFREDGSYLLTCDNLIPTIDSTPFEDYPISDLSATLDPEKGMKLVFVCTVKGVPFTVSADVTYLHEQAMEVVGTQQ